MNLSKIKLALAPMAGITDKAFRQVCQENGTDITWSEMVSAEGLVRQTDNPNNKSLALAEKFSSQEKNYWVQIFGTEPKSMAEAAKIIERKIKPTGIDINLGCPVKKAQKAGYGVIQLNDIPKVIKIIKEIKKEISLPLSLKTRLGLKEPTEILDFAPKLVEAGLDQLVIHARTLPGMFKEKPNWQIVKKLVDTLSIPIIYNGGITNKKEATFYAEKTGCQTLMIGQATIGNPWIFSVTKTPRQDLSVDQKEKVGTILRHAELIKKYYSEKGLITFRTHLLAYLKGYPNSRQLRLQASKISSLEDVREIVKKI